MDIFAIYISILSWAANFYFPWATYEKVLEESLQFRFLEKKTDYLSFIY